MEGEGAELNGRRKERLTHAVAALLLLVLVIQCALSMRVKSPTVDEFVHLPVGYSLLRHRDFLTDPINPPLMRVWAALPLLAHPPKWSFPDDAVRSQFWQGAYQFMWENEKDYHSLFLRARWMIVILSVLLGFYVYRWASLLHGPRCGLAALFLYSLSPNIVAHSRLVTADLGGACFMFLTVFHFWRWRRTRTWCRLLLWGFFLGISFLSKLTAVLLPAVLIVLLVVDGWNEIRNLERRDRNRLLLMLAVAALTAIFVLNAGYCFRGTFRLLGSYTFRSGTMSQFQALMPGFLPGLLPEGFLMGIDHALRHGGDLPEGSFYLLGELSSTGWWYYFLIAWLVKVPIPVTAGLLIVLAWHCRPKERASPRHCSSGDGLFLLIPAAGFFLFLSTVSSLNIGFRHVLVVLPFAFVAVSRLALAVNANRKGLSACFAAGGLWYVASALTIFPDHLAYFNEFAGGPDGGARCLVDSNLDWGQDLVQLRRYLEARGNPKIKLGYFGRVDPRVYGISYEPLSGRPTSGLVVVSVTFLQGRPYLFPVPLEKQAYRVAPAGYFSWLQDYEPVGRVGHTLYIYEIPEEQAAALR